MNDLPNFSVRVTTLTRYETYNILCTLDPSNSRWLNLRRRYEGTTDGFPGESYLESLPGYLGVGSTKNQSLPAINVRTFKKIFSL